MKNFRNILALLIILIFQVGMGRFLSMWQVVPNFILIIILSWCLIYDYSEALIWAFIGGFFLEIYENPVFFGTNIISAVLVVSIANAILHYILKEINYWIIFLTGFLGTVLYDILQLGLKQQVNWVNAGLFGDFLGFNLKMFLWEGVINGILLIGAMYILKRTKRISSRLKRFE